MSVQETIETKLSVLLKEPVEIIGCGRTDTGVHALSYYAHLDTEVQFEPQDLMYRLNKMIGEDISIEKIFPVENDLHARFSATKRSYEYRISLKKNPFQLETSWHFPFYEKLNLENMQATAELLLEYKAFAPFCKTNSDVQTMLCELSRSIWFFSEEEARYHITSNRFLRGMVRLIVGACINVGLNQLTIKEVRDALETQKPLKKSYSVPPTGLFLTEVIYPEFSWMT